MGFDAKADEGIALDNLVKISKQSTTANRRALEDGSLQNVPASMRQEESFDAQRRIYDGAKPCTALQSFNLSSRPYRLRRSLCFA